MTPRAIPDELLEAARVDGASVHVIFRKLMVPMSIPAIATLVIFNALYVWNEFVFALLLLHDDKVRTLTVGVNQMQGKFFFDYPALLAGLLITSHPDDRGLHLLPALPGAGHRGRGAQVGDCPR